MEDDTHYGMTYVICRTVGFTHDEAVIVAAADVAMDDLDALVAAGTTDGHWQDANIPQAHVDASWMWHALAPADTATSPPLLSTADILQQKDLLFQLALDRWLDPGLDRDLLETWTPSPDYKKQQLVWLGVFFHYQQDTWAHRRTTATTNTRMNWEAYQTPFGHVDLSPRPGQPRTIHQPDRPPWNPLGALRNLEDGIFYAGIFLHAALGRKPNPNFVNFEITPWEDRVDNTWTKGKPGFNQLRRVATTEAGKYLEELIRAHIEAYTYDGSSGPNELDLPSVLLACAKVWMIHGPKLGLDKDDLFRSAALIPQPKPERKAALGSIGPVDSNERVAKMGGWQDALGFPTTTAPYLILGPHQPTPDRDLRKLLGPWGAISKDPPPGVSALLDISAGSGPDPYASDILVVGSDHNLWYRRHLPTGRWDAWQQIPADAVTAAKMRPDGLIVAINNVYGLIVKANLGARWEPMYPNLERSDPIFSLINLALKRDGTIIGVMQDGQLHTAKLKRDPSRYAEQVRPIWSEYVLEGGWQAAPKDVPVIAVTVLPNQESFLGVSQRGILLYKRTLDTPWKRAPNCNAFSHEISPQLPAVVGGACALGPVAMLPAGDLVGIRRHTVEVLLKGTDQTWQRYDVDGLAQSWTGIQKTGPHLLDYVTIAG